MSTETSKKKLYILFTIFSVAYSTVYVVSKMYMPWFFGINTPIIMIGIFALTAYYAPKAIETEAVSYFYPIYIVLITFYMNGSSDVSYLSTMMSVLLVIANITVAFMVFGYIGAETSYGAPIKMLALLALIVIFSISTNGVFSVSAIEYSFEITGKGF
jgi:hypothetical protein